MAVKMRHMSPGRRRNAGFSLVELMVASTLGWTGAATPYTTDAARALYSDPKRRWLCDQVRQALDERELFMRSSAQA